MLLHPVILKDVATFVNQNINSVKEHFCIYKHMQLYMVLTRPFLICSVFLCTGLWRHEGNERSGI